MKRFAIHPGKVRSQSDGQWHDISGADLARLYGLDEADCYIVRETIGEQIDPEWMPLYPLPDGRYKDHLLQIKVSHFDLYRTARKLYAFHESGASPHRHLRGIVMAKQGKIIARWDRQWPDFRAAYDKLETRK